MDAIRIPVAGDGFYAASRRRATDQDPDRNPHCCYDGWVYLGRLIPTPDGDEEEIRRPLLVGGVVRND